MIAIPSPMLRRILALAILGMMLTLAWSWLAAPIVDYIGDRRATVQRLQTRLLASRHIARQGAELRARLAVLKADPALELSFVEASSEALGTAWLQDKLKQIAGAQGLTISSLQSMGADTGHGFRTVAMRAAMSGQIGQLQPMLHALETHAPILVIRNLDLRSTGSRSPRSLDKEDARLSIRMDVTAYLKAPSP